MSRSNVDKIVEAVLYEGYILYPYRPSSTKNRQRFTFGRVYPEAFSEAEKGAEPCVMQTECLVEASGDTRPRLGVQVRFLHPIARDVGRLPAPLRTWPKDAEPTFEEVPALQTNGEIYQSWQEAVECDIPVAPQPLDELTEKAKKHSFSFAASRELEPIRDRHDRIVGVLVRRRHALAGAVEVSAWRLSDTLYRATVRIVNRTPVPAPALEDPDAVIMRTFASTHTILRVQQGAFISLMDPPLEHAAAAEACQNEGTWPVLVGDEEKGERDTMLSSPIILYDYPEVAPESPGNFFDSTEIDEMLTLRIMTMTDEEKREMRGADERARQMLERTENLPEEQLLKLHGAIRDLDSAGTKRAENEAHDEKFFSDKRPLDEVTIGGARYRPGARVRIQPSGRGTDVMDLMLKGKTAIIEAVEQDFEDRIYLALVLEDDPGRDLGMMRQPGHRFFFSPEEVELLEEEASP